MALQLLTLHVYAITLKSAVETESTATVER